MERVGAEGVLTSGGWGAQERLQRRGGFQPGSSESLNLDLQSISITYTHSMPCSLQRSTFTRYPHRILTAFQWDA